MRVLVRAPNWLGDLIISLGFFNKLFQLYPDSEVHVIIKEELSEFVSFIPKVSYVYRYSKKRYRGLLGVYRFAKKVSKKGLYDIFFCLPDSFSSAFMGFYTRSKIRVGYRKEFRSIFLTHSYDKPLGLHRAEEYAFLLHEFLPDVLEDLDVKINISNHNNLNKIELPNNRLNIVLNINSEASSRRMSLRKWAFIANALIRKLDCTIILIGTEKEKNYTNSLRQLIEFPQNIIDLSGKTTLPSLSNVLKMVDLMISTDSGPAHLANCLGTNVIVLFGAGDEKTTAPYNKSNLFVMRAKGVKCAPCVKNTCIFELPQCLEKMDEEIIVEHSLKMLRK